MFRHGRLVSAGDEIPLYIAATSLRLGCCTIGAFYDDEVNQLIGADGQRGTAIYLGGVGHVH